MTAKGLFQLLEDHPDSILLLEDMETLCKDPNAAGVLRSALVTNPSHKGKGRQERLVTWHISKQKRSVYFSGAIILIMNSGLDDLPELRAVATRISVEEFQPTQAEIAALMKSIALDGYQRNGHQLDQKDCIEVYQFVKGVCDNGNRKYDLRMLIHGFHDLMQWQAGHSETHWHDLITSRLRKRVVVSTQTQPWDFGWYVWDRDHNGPTQVIYD